MDNSESADAAEPAEKKMKLDENGELKSCKHYVKRKKRFCKMTVAKGKEYCGEHLSEAAENLSETTPDRIPCPLDPKHSVYSKNLRKHLKICNARPKEQPPYIVSGINLGEPVEDDPSDSWKLSEFSSEHVMDLIGRVEKVYKDEIEAKITESYLEHDILAEEVAKTEYGHETMKHLIQTSSILGCLRDLGLLQPKTSFIDFGSGKGQLSYWLARAIEGLDSANVVLLDRASHRHKKDNKIEDKSFIHRIRADIADFDVRKLDLLSEKQVVIVSKHLCGIATDLALRCMVKGLMESQDTKAAQMKGFLIALCCHHRCEWRSYVGKEEFLRNGFSRKDFNLLTKLVSWAVCGSGMSRERRKLMEESRVNEAETNNEQNALGEGEIRNKISPERRAEVGKMCKRLIDYCRLRFMEKNNFRTSLRYYVRNDVTLENVCLIGQFVTVDQ
ncbi:unnamed protein product [Hermetia illucens]|uniref:tRNA:m(4)X modification enzyme TRM13 n=1 Tax=Hermetia illucens TaxID=343691 RepID=A0A7R8UPA9_HERIL|nr:tRNA:m(4)X modification enzyme TRM13 homolog [Hermetia illucens]CAD7084522.1 unnamed protein product [Hermetia illucens]